MCANPYLVDYLLSVHHRIRERSYHQVGIEISACIDLLVAQLRRMRITSLIEQTVTAE